MADDAEMLAVQVRSLEAEVRKLKESKRDEFAKAALTGLVHWMDEIDADQVARIGRLAFALADAMLKAREARG